MADDARLDPVEVARAVRDLVRKDTDRVDNPHFIPEDRIGWHATKPLKDDAAGAPYYEPESWRWFDLVSVGFVDEMVLISFRWTDPTTPDLRYRVLFPADGSSDAGSVAAIARGQLRNLLTAGWRDRVAKRWFSTSDVLIWEIRDINTEDQALKDRLTARHQETYDRIWTTPRSTHAE